MSRSIKPMPAAVIMIVLLAFQATAGDPLGWSTAAQVVADSGTSAGAVLTIIGIIATGAVVWFGLTSLLSITLPMTLGGIIMAQAEQAQSALFGASGGGASILGFVASGSF